MEPLQCRRVDLARAGLPPGAPLDPGSAAHVRDCGRCRDAIRLDTLGTESLRRQASAGPPRTLSSAGRARLDAAINARLTAYRPGSRAGAFAPYLAAAAVIALSIALGTRLAEAVAPPVSEATAASEPSVDAPALLEALVARHRSADLDPAAAPMPDGVLYATRLPAPMAIGVLPAKGVAFASASCPWAGDERDSTLFVLDRARVDVDPELASSIALEGSVSVVLLSARVTVAERDERLFVTVTTLDPVHVVAGRM